MEDKFWCVAKLDDWSWLNMIDDDGHFSLWFFFSSSYPCMNSLITVLIYHFDAESVFVYLVFRRISDWQRCCDPFCFYIKLSLILAVTSLLLIICLARALYFFGRLAVLRFSGWSSNENAWLIYWLFCWILRKILAIQRLQIIIIDKKIMMMLRRTVI